jgi:hypothetical protein
MSGIEFEPYQKEIKSIVVQELSAGQWVELIRFPISDPYIKPKDVQEIIEHLHTFIYKSEKAEMSIQGCQVCIKGVDQKGTYRIVASAKKCQHPYFENE